MEDPIDTGLTDKYGNSIYSGDTVRFRAWNHWWSEVVIPYKDGFLPFNGNDRIGFSGISAKDCEVTSRGKWDKWLK